MFEQIWKLIKYHPFQENELYKIHMIKELNEGMISAVNLNISKEENLCCYWYGACSGAFYSAF